MARLLYFASLQDTMGVREEQMELPGGWTVANLLDHLEQRQPSMRPMRGRYRVAVDLEMASESTALQDAKEVALIPPMSGGRGPWIKLGPEPIEVEQVLQAVQRPDCGAVLLFLGTVRNQFEGRPVEHIDYSVYPELALKQLHTLGEQALDQMDPGAVALWHRTGLVEAGEVSVVVGVATPHRAEAFTWSRWLIDQLKAEVPIWKKELGPGGACWIEGDARIPAT